MRFWTILHSGPADDYWLAQCSDHVFHELALFSIFPQSVASSVANLNPPGLWTADWATGVPPQKCAAPCEFHLGVVSSLNHTCSSLIPFLPAGKFSLSVGSGKKKDRKHHHIIPDVFAKGAITWPTQVSFSGCAYCLAHVG